MDDAQKKIRAIQVVSMSLEWFHAVLGAVFIGIWLIVGQIMATDRR